MTRACPLGCFAFAIVCFGFAIVATVSGIVSPPFASAQVAPQETEVVTTTPPAPARAPAADPQADRVVLLPTAYTHPKGTWYVSDYEIAILQAGYAFTDDTQLTVSTVPPLGAERLAILDFTLKTSVYRGGLVRVAALGSASGAIGQDIGMLFIGRLGGVVQLCLRGACDSGFILSSNLALAGPVILMVNGVGAIWRIARRVSLLAEVATLVPVGREANQWNGGALSGGFRFHFTNWGFDLALAHALRGGNLPLLAITYRSPYSEP